MVNKRVIDDDILTSVIPATYDVERNATRIAFPSDILKRAIDFLFAIISYGK